MRAPAPSPAARKPSSRAPLVVAGIALALLGIGALGIGIAWLAGGEDEVADALPAPQVPVPLAVPEAPPPPPSVRDPFADPPPEPIASLYARVRAGGSLSRMQVRTVRRWARENGDDVRANLLLGHSYTNERSLSWGLPEYEEAMERDPSARGYPEMLPDLLEMARSHNLERAAADRIVEWYGAEALPAIDAELTKRLRPDEERRLDALRARIASE